MRRPRIRNRPPLALTPRPRNRRRVRAAHERLPELIEAVRGVDLRVIDVVVWV